MWLWITIAFFVGMFFGFWVIGLLAAGATESSYRAGFQEGHTEGFEDGLKEVGKVG
jgi:hypothetical protein